MSDRPIALAHAPDWAKGSLTGQRAHDALFQRCQASAERPITLRMGASSRLRSNRSCVWPLKRSDSVWMSYPESGGPHADGEPAA
jgi:hypothetical protein